MILFYSVQFIETTTKAIDTSVLYKYCVWNISKGIIKIYRNYKYALKIPGTYYY